MTDVELYISFDSDGEMHIGSNSRPLANRVTVPLHRWVDYKAAKSSLLVNEKLLLLSAKVQS